MSYMSSSSEAPSNKFLESSASDLQSDPKEVPVLSVSDFLGLDFCCRTDWLGWVRMWAAAFVRTRSPWITSCVVALTMMSEPTLSWSENSSTGWDRVPSVKVDGVGGILLLDLELKTPSGVTTIVGMEAVVGMEAIDDEPTTVAVGWIVGRLVNKRPVSLWI
jgi:hypothetical protein